MADPELSGDFLILLGDGGDPETFGFPCGATVRSVTFGKTTGEETLLDCDDPVGAAAAVSRWVEGSDTNLSISGRVAKQFFEQWRAFADDPEGRRNVRVEVYSATAGEGGHWDVPAILTEFEMGAEGKGTMTFSATLAGAASRSWTAAPA
ncbi:phage tail tube protein [Aestuariibius insulae]|uniref:phage tail tube protein n=1 Tax=Aestuariibius insulae TaxID=2058287 RepID=UPI00345EE5B7